MSKESEKTWTEDDMGVPLFKGKAIGDAWHAGYHDPFTRMLELIRHVESPILEAAIHIHDDLDICRSIAVSIYGRSWPSHVMEVYDRFRKTAVRLGGLK